MNPYERPSGLGEFAHGTPPLYRLARSLVSLSRAAPVMRCPRRCGFVSAALMGGCSCGEWGLSAARPFGVREALGMGVTGEPGLEVGPGDGG